MELQAETLSPTQIRDSIALRLAGLNSNLSTRLLHLDDWQLDSMAEFVRDAHALAKSWDTPLAPTVAGEGEGETKVG